MNRFIGLKLDGRYEITELIGVGGMSNVYKGIDIMERRTVAVKILKREFCENDEFVRRFRNESKAIAVLNHPNIVRIFDVNYENDIQYIVMEYIDGITLKEFIEQRGRLEWRDTVHITIQILRALQLAHDRGIVHRDIKPQNIMLLPDGTIKVMDFGIARFCRDNSTTLTEKTMGSVHYVSPEQASAERTDERSDLYSVGVIMYEMLTGRKPFDGDTPVAVALMHINDTPVKPSEYVSSLYKGLEEIILHAMEKDPAKRYRTASCMIYDIESFKRDQSITFGYEEQVPVQNKNNIGSKLIDKLSSFVGNISIPERKKAVETEQDDDEEEEYEEVRHSYVLPILAAVTVTVIIVATLFISNVILSAFKTTPSSSNDYVMPQLVGKNFYDARNLYPNIQLVASEEFNSQYETGVIISQEKAEGRIVKIGDAIRVVVSKGKRIVTVPDVLELHYNAAYAALTGEYLKVLRIDIESEDITAGHVVMTEPAANESVDENSIVKVYVSMGPSTEDTTVPYVEGYYVTEAEDMLSEYFLIPKVQYIESNKPRDIVVEQSIEAESVVTRNTVVTLYVSDGLGDEYYPGYDDDVNIDDEDDYDYNYNQYSQYVYVNVSIPYGTSGIYYLSVVDSYGNVLMPNEMVDTYQYSGGSYQISVPGEGYMDAYVQVTSPRTGYSMNLCKLSINFELNSYSVSDYTSVAFFAVDMNF